MTRISDPAPASGEPAMIWLEGGTFRMGSDRHYAEEAPERTVSTNGFLIDPTPVTNRQFAAFVEATGYVTLAEIAPTLDDYPDADPALLKAGSAVFFPTDGPVDLSDHNRWWRYVFDAHWRDPEGTGRGIESRLDHPVVQIAYQDALAYADWAGKSLPTEIEWEYAARGGLMGRDYAWGDEIEPDGQVLANYWRGEFPWRSSAPSGAARTSAVGSFPANGFGLYDMIGNVWEWTVSHFGGGGSDSPCCAISRTDDARGLLPRVIKGGSHLCAANYCRRYRPAARHSQPPDSPTTHIGFRCVRHLR